MIALIDSDIVAYRCAASAEGEEPDVALSRVDELMERILFNTNAESYKSFLGGKENFRKVISEDYKANRKDKPKPIHLTLCRDYLLSTWSSEISSPLEADDSLGIACGENTVICSIDKDLRQVPGTHFNFVKMDWTVVDEYQAAFNFYRQFLIGDTSDNIKGVVGIGEKKAEKELYGLTPDEMFDRVRELYNDDERMLTNGRLLYIWRKEFDLWTPEKLNHVSIGTSQLERVRVLLFGSSVMTEEDSFLTWARTGAASSGSQQDGISPETAAT